MPTGGLYPRFYFRDWRNADKFKPNATPPRQDFQGFVDFSFNPDVLSIIDGSELRAQISSLVQTADLPSISFRTEQKNQYNIKRIAQTGVDFSDVKIEVLDTVDNEWLLVFMKYFSFHYGQPRNRTSRGNGTIRDRAATGYEDNQTTLTKSSSFMGESFNSIDAGLDIGTTGQFINQISLVTYHGGKGVEYILFNPIIKDFTPGGIDYSSSAVRKFSMTFEYENFTINEKVNFTLDGADKARWEDANIEFGFDGNDAAMKDKVVVQRDQDFLGTSDRDGTLYRKSQPDRHGRSSSDGANNIVGPPEPDKPATQEWDELSDQFFPLTNR